MSKYSDPNYDPGFLNSPGKGQSPTNPLAPAFIESLGVVSDLSVYRDIFAGNTVNAATGFTLGVENFFSKDFFQVGSPGVFKEDIAMEKNLTVGINVTAGNNLIAGNSVVVQGRVFTPTQISTESGSYTVLASS